MSHKNLGAGLIPKCTRIDLYTKTLTAQIFFRFYLFILRERGGEGEREGKKHQYVVASCVPPTGGLAHNPVLCPN